MSLGLPLTDEIRKKAFTDKGILRKGWYYEENGLLTNGKHIYIPENKLEHEYSYLEDNLKKEAEDLLYKASWIEVEDWKIKYNNNKKLEWLIDSDERYEFYKTLLPKLKKV